MAMALTFNNMPHCASVEPEGNESYMVRGHVDMFLNRREIAGFSESIDGKACTILCADGGSMIVGKNEEIPVTCYAARAVAC